MSTYSSSGSSDALIGTLGIGLSLIIVAAVLLVCIIFWIVQQFPYYRMAKNQGMSNAWLAFIPYGNFYITLKLSPREFNLFNWIRWDDRIKALWAFLIATGVYMILIVPVVFISMIPIIGIVIYMVYILAYVAISYSIIWRMNYDLLITYRMQEHAMWASIVNIFCPFVMIVFSYIIMNKEPDYYA